MPAAARALQRGRPLRVRHPLPPHQTQGTNPAETHLPPAPSGPERCAGGAPSPAAALRCAPLSSAPLDRPLSLTRVAESSGYRHCWLPECAALPHSAPGRLYRPQRGSAALGSGFAPLNVQPKDRAPEPEQPPPHFFSCSPKPRFQTSSSSALLREA